ncbi:MAG: LysR family transcriptional regulator [Neisseriaceae bacterium]|nr:LysR family transcriptional regulator [Neisseriaceae bacterium]MBP6861649.1 LysR family transcriptional regulator [Neisseriaceae bacterium]
MQADLNDLYYFVKVIEYGGFSAAGRALGIPKSKLSRRVALLEERLGVRLIHRSTRRFSLTDLGQTFFEHCQAMLVEADAAHEAIMAVQSEPKGVVRVSCPVALLHVNIGPMLAEFMLAYPHIIVHLDASNRAVDVVGEGFDMAIRVRPGPLADSELVLRVLAERGQCLVASPKLVKAMGGLPDAPADLAEWPSLAIGQPQNAHVWTLFGPEERQVALHHRPRYVTTDMVALRDAALVGVGVVQLPLLMIQTQLDSGELVSVLPDWAPRREIVHAVYPSRRGQLPAVRLLLDYLAQKFKCLCED